VDVRSRHDSAIDPPFNLRREDVGDVAVVVVEGEVDIVTAPALQEELESIAPGTSVVIDLCDTPFMDSTGLWVLFAARQPDGRVHIACGPSGPVARLFEVVAGTHTLPKVFATRGEALAAFW
jgi:anti-anti-sigma factor